MMDRIVYIGGVGPRGRLEAYPCRRCGDWHIGHSWPDLEGGRSRGRILDTKAVYVTG